MTGCWHDHNFAPVARRIRSMSHPIRMSIVCLLAEKPLSVGEICEQLGTTQPNISQHLRVLFNQKILVYHKDGSRVNYAIADERVLAIIDKLRNIYCD